MDSSDEENPAFNGSLWAGLVSILFHGLVVNVLSLHDVVDSSTLKKPVFYKFHIGSRYLLSRSSLLDIMDDILVRVIVLTSVNVELVHNSSYRI